MQMLGALEAGGTKMVCAIGRSPQEIVGRIEFPTTTPAQSVQHAIDFFRANAPLKALGVASFGPIDIDPASPNYGMILKTPKAGWSGFDLARAFAPLSIPVVIDTDVNGAAIAEQWAAGGAPKTLAYVTVGTGVGVGVAVGGKSLSGMRHYEMGHLRPPHDRALDPFGGACPFHGDCVEGLASGSAIVKRWGAPLNKLQDGAVDLIAGYIAELAHAIILAQMPDRIIFGGGVMKTPGLIDKVRAKTRALAGGYIEAPALSGDWRDFIMPPALGDNAGVAGALLLAANGAAGLSPPLASI